MQKTKIFFTDDHVALRDAMAKDINTSDNFEVIGFAANGAEAITAFEEGLEADIILLDLSMPVTDGCTVAEWLSINRPAVKILIMTMGANPQQLSRLLAAGVTVIVNKDVTRFELMEALEKIMAGENHFSSSVTRGIAELYRQENGRNEAANKLQLSKAEVQFIQLCTTDLTYKEIGDKLGLTKHATENLRVHLFARLEMKSRTALAMFAVKEGLVDIL